VEAGDPTDFADGKCAKAEGHGCPGRHAIATFSRHDGRVSFAIVLYLDHKSDRRIRSIWAALDLRGVVSAGTEHVNDRPHVTLAVFDECVPDMVVPSLRDPLDDVSEIPLVLASVGFFLNAKAPAFLGVVPSTQLLSVHAAVQTVIAPLVTGNSGYYKQQNWVPHCTLAMGAPPDATGAIVGAVSGFDLPIRARAQSAHLVQLATRQSAAHLSSPAAVPQDVLSGLMPPPPPIFDAAVTK
jgi:2'-5' RNA ligase